MTCPQCDLLNPDTAQRCDCGYDFVSKDMRESYLSPQSTARASGRTRFSSRRWWPIISDQISAKKAAATGAECAFVVAGITGIAAVVSIFTPLDFAEPSSLADALVIALLGFLIQRKASRIAAVTAMVLFVGERIYAGIEHGFGAAVGVLAVILLLGFISGVRGTFAYHAYRRRSDKEYTGVTLL
jgi:hypothetical protein